MGIKGKLDVRSLEIGYGLGGRTLRLRATPVSGPAVDFQTSDSETIDRLLRIAELKSHGARVAVEIEGEELTGIDVAVGGGGARAD
jgi:hypothetical protein